jgi:hypothetical protein
MNDIPLGVAIIITGTIFGALIFMGIVISAVLPLL